MTKRLIVYGVCLWVAFYTLKAKNIPAEIGALLYSNTSFRLCNSKQKKAMEESRLGIPVLFGHDVIHGFRTVYPISLAQACSWNPALVEKACAMAAREARLAGLDWTFSPMIDVARDPRWGRVSEGYGEGPYTNGVFAVASVKGYQGGVPASAHSYTMREVLKGCWKHDGFVVSDWGSIVQLISQGAAENLQEASEKAIMAGVNMDMMSRGYDKYLKELVEEGKVPMKIVDDAVRRILRLKFRLGLFENPYIRETTEKERFLQSEDIKLAEKLAEESLVLLKDKEKYLPLAADTKVAVIGPLGKNCWNLLGSWTAYSTITRLVKKL